MRNKLLTIKRLQIFRLHTTALVTAVAIEKTTCAGGGLIPSMTSSLVTSDCLKSGRLLRKKPIKHGCGEALSNLSRRSQNSSGSTFVSINSCINVLTFLSTAFGSRLDNSNKFAKNFRHFSLMLSVFCRCYKFFTKC